MTLRTLISQSRLHYWRYYRLVVLAVILMMAVLSGSLLLGDSVRGTLLQRVSERLGNTETVIASGTGFLQEEILQTPLLADAEGFLLVDGFVSVNDKLLPVYVWGTDGDSLQYGEALVNTPLSGRLEGVEDIVLHLPSHNLVPSGTLFVTQNYATQMRLHIQGQKSVEQGGNLLLRNEQTLPLNVFVNRRQLAEVMELEGKVNLLLSDKVITREQFEDTWLPVLSGIHVNDTSLTYDGIFIPNSIVDKADGDIYFSYLVNDIICGTDTVPYSFVTAVSQWQGDPLTGREIILSDYAAEHLHVSEGDSVRMSYFLAKDIKTLETNELKLRVKSVVSLDDFMQDSLLTADFPGLSNVERCADWDSDLPIRMDRVHKADEDFWHTYRQTPKAIVAYDAVRDDWTNAFGSATAIRLHNSSAVASSVSSGDVGILLVHPRAEGLDAAVSGVDFSSLFLALGAFIILAAILLMACPIQEMFAQRRAEILLYQQLGFSSRQIASVLFREVFGAMLLASPLGILAGLLYSSITLWLLGNVWSGATHTEGFALHIHLTTLLVSWLVGMILCGITLIVVIRQSVVRQHVAESEGSAGIVRQHIIAGTLLAATLVLIAVNFILFHSMMLFILCGLMWVVVFGLFLRARILYMVNGTRCQSFSRGRLMWHSIRASMRQHLLAYWSLSLGVFTVFAVGLNRPDFSDTEQLTGGFQLYVESRVPIQYDLNIDAVRRKLSVNGLPDSTQFLLFMRHTQDEASCLNLNKVTTPTVLGVDLRQMESFGILPPAMGNSVGQQAEGDRPVSVYVDQESLVWSLMKSVGDTISYLSSTGEKVSVQIAGSYPTGIFHGNAIMSAEDFRRMWPKESGAEVLLVRTPNTEETAEVLATALSEYGLTIQLAGERLHMFFEVTETYLLIFLTLGGLGLLLGIFSLVVIVRKNITAQLPAIRQYQAMGFPVMLIRQLLLRENLLVPFYAVAVGVLGSFISISANVTGAGLATFASAFGLLVLFCLFIYYGIKHIINKTI